MRVKLGLLGSWLCAIASGALPARAQQPSSGTAPLAAICERNLTAGSATERTALIAALASGREFSSVLRPLRLSDASTALRAARALVDSAGQPHCARLWLPLSIYGWYNTSRAQTDRDGPVWQGKGFTASVSGGVASTWGRFDVALRPIAMFAENRAFTPSLGASPAGDFRDPFWGTGIDLPYRFGTGGYRVLDPGESHIRLDYRTASIGASTASQHWGPAHYYPLVLSTEAAGYPRVFAEARGVPVLIGHATAHWQVGWLEASPYSGLGVGSRSRVVAALMASFRPGVLRALEIGGARFFHVRRDSTSMSWSLATLPLSGLLKSGSRDSDVGGFNQLASLFARVSPVGSGVEVYGELYREDHNANLRDLIGEPDHASAYVIGVRRAWSRGPTLSVLTLERANGRISHLTRVRAQSPIYLHNAIFEGHTFRGQSIGSSAMLGGGGTLLSWIRIAEMQSTHVTAELRSTAQNREGGVWDGRYGGLYAFNIFHTRFRAAKSYGVGLGIQTGSGVSRYTNLTLAFKRGA